MSFLLTVVACALGTAQEVAQDRAVIERWARTITFTSFEARFSVRYSGTGNAPPRGSLVGTGVWRVRVRPSFAEYVAVDGRESPTETGERAASWDSSHGEGRESHRDRAELLGRGRRAPMPPKLLGAAELPAALPFVAHDERSLGKMLVESSLDWSVERVPGDAGNLALFLRGMDRLLVYLLRFSPEPTIVEKRLYVQAPVGTVLLKNKSLGDGLDLPTGYQHLVCFSRHRVIDSAVVGGARIPVRWTIEHALGAPGETFEVAFDPQSIRLNPVFSDRELRVTWPVGTNVYDQARRQWFCVGPDQEERERGEFITEAVLENVLALAVPPVVAGRQVGSFRSDDAPVATGCGANALYLACRMLGKPVRLDELAQGLGIDSQEPESSIAAIGLACREREIEAYPIRGEPRVIERAPGEPALLHVMVAKKRLGQRSLRVPHFIIVDDFERISGTVRVFDPPRYPFRTSRERLLDAWTGDALLLGPGSIALGESLVASSRARVAARAFAASLSPSTRWRTSRRSLHRGARDVRPQAHGRVAMARR